MSVVLGLAKNPVVDEYNLANDKPLRTKELIELADEASTSKQAFYRGKDGTGPTKRYPMQGARRVLQWVQKYIYAEAVAATPVLCGQAVLSGLRWALLGGEMDNSELQKLVYK